MSDDNGKEQKDEWQVNINNSPKTPLVSVKNIKPDLRKSKQSSYLYQKLVEKSSW